MSDRFCGRCGKETDKLKTFKISVGNANFCGSTNYKVEICEECQKENKESRFRYDEVKESEEE